MEFINNHILSLVIFFPVAAALIIMLLPREEKTLIHRLGILLALIEFFISLHLYFHFVGTGTFEYTEMLSWIPTWKINYFVGIDGVSLLLILLSTFLTPLVLLSATHAVTTRVKEFVMAVLVLEAGMVGVFSALDFFLFYVFWEVMLVPMYLLIGVWGGKRKIYAALKFFIYTMAGSLLMLIAILYIYSKTGTFSLVDLYEQGFDPAVQFWLFAAFALAFAIKVPLFPLHTWLPDAHVEAPTAGSVILAGVLLKMGTYGFFRFAMPLFPQAFIVFQPYLIFLSVVGIVYGALVAMVQTDIKKLIAYSSVSHLGVVMLGLFALDRTAMMGGLFQMLAHGISTGALFFLVGIIYERTHSRAIAEHSGVMKIMPWYGVVFVLVTMSSIGLPLTNGFVGEFLTLVGSFQTARWPTIVAASGVILSAVYMLWMVERVFYGEAKTPVGIKIPDLSLREIVVLVPLIVFILWMGIMPKTFMKTLDAPIEQLFMQMAGDVTDAEVK
ncbi:NADH-quinone oxidoreductase subunit M [bacterium]|nr:NADH-quinone oxidoreductase subunit M [bacterium]